MKGILAIALVVAGSAQYTPQDNAGMELEGLGRTCVALAVFSEARGEPIMGQVAIAEVVKARAESADYPDDLCQVVQQSGQFHGVRDWPRGVHPADIDAPAWELALQITDRVLLGHVQTECAGATHFYAGKEPSWARGMTSACGIGAHAFRGVSE